MATVSRRVAHGVTAAQAKAWRARWGEGPHLTTDVVLFTARSKTTLSILLIRRGKPPWLGAHALPGGFVKEDEALESAARRELAEETGVELDDVPLVQVGTFGDPGRDPRARVLTVVYSAFVPFERIEHAKAGDDAAAVGFFDLKNDRPVDARGRPLALAADHADIVKLACERLGRRKSQRSRISTAKR